MTVSIAKVNGLSFRNPSLYANKVILAPMVRVGSLPMRLLALHSGADLVYSPEIVDKSIIGAVRIVNSNSGTIDYVKEGKLVFRTHPVERDRLVFQLGSADPSLALEAALTVQNDVAAFDLNCGCPKRFSLQGGMGAALLKSPERLVSILENLLTNTQRPVSAKIRLFLAEEKPATFTFSDTESLVDRIVRTGISALAIHARDPCERSEKHPAHWNLFRKLSQTFRSANQEVYGHEKHANYATLILNGDIGLRDNCAFEPEQTLQSVLADSGASSVMTARAAQWNPLCVRRLKENLCAVNQNTRNIPPLSFTGVSLDPAHVEMLNDMVESTSSQSDLLLASSRRFLVLAQSTNNPFTNSKYNLLQIWNNAGSQPLSSGHFDAFAAKALARDYAVKVQQSRQNSDFYEMFNVPRIEMVDDNCAIFSDFDE